MNLVFIGSSSLGLRCLETCFQTPDVSVVGLVTAPQTFAISYRPGGVSNILHADLATLAKAHQVPVRTLERTMNEPGVFEEVAQWKPDVFLVVGWYHMIPRRWRELAPAYGMHASLLPDYSGGAPLVWAMINGELKTGITLFQMDGGVDSGPIAFQKEEPIFPRDTIATLYARIEERGLEVLREALPQLVRGTLALRPQDAKKRRVVPQRSPEDGLIDWSRNAVCLDRFIRAQTRPYPGAFTTIEGKRLYIWQARVECVLGADRDVGLVRWTQDGTYAVGCGVGAIVLDEVTYKDRTYTQEELRDCFEGGGQKCGT